MHYKYTEEIVQNMCQVKDVYKNNQKYRVYIIYNGCGLRMHPSKSPKVDRHSAIWGALCQQE